MESTCSKRLLAAPSDETEWYLYAKQIKIESDQETREKEEKQKVEQSIQCGTGYQMSLHGPLYLSERQNHWELEKRSCDRAKKTYMREFFCSKNCSNEGLPCRVSENELSTKRWSPENGDQNTAEDDISLNVYRQHLETELSVSSAADTCQNLQVLNPPQVQQNNTTEGNNDRNGDNRLKQNSSVASSNRHSFQMELLRRKSVSDKKWQQYRLLQIPVLSGTSSVFSHTKNKNNFLKSTCSAEDKNYSSSNTENTTERDNKEKNSSLYIIPSLKPFKSIPPLEIPNFHFSNISNKINSKMSSTNSRETDWKNFEGKSCLVQSKQINGVHKISEIEKQKLQNDKSSARTSTVGSEFKEKNNPPTNKQEHSVSAEEVSATYFRGDSTDIECNKMFAENDFKDEMLENSEGDDNQKSKILIYISTKNVQNEKRVSCNDLLQRMGRKSSNENAGTFHIQTSIPVITEALEKNKLDLHCVVHNSNSDISLYEAESKLSTKEILDCQRYVRKSIIFERNCPHIIVRNFPDKTVSSNIFRGKKMFKLMFSFQNMLFEWVRTWTKSSYEDRPTSQDESVTPWLHCRDILNEGCDGQELVKRTINRNHKDKILICLLAVISKPLNVELLKTILASLFSSTNTLLPVEGKPMQVEKQPLCGRMQNQFNSCTDDTWRQNTEFLNENCTYPGFVSYKFVETIDLELSNGWQRTCFSRSLGKEEYTCLQRGVLFHNQKGRLCKRRNVRKHHLLSRENEGFSTYLRSVSHKNSTKKQNLVVKCLILLQGTPDCSSLDKTYCCNITKIQYLVGANLKFQSYFPVHSQGKFEKVNSTCTNQEILVTNVKQERKKPSIMLNSSFHVGRFKAFPFVLCEKKKHKTTEYRNCITSANEVTNEVTHTMEKYFGTFSCINDDGEEQVNSEESEIKSHNFFSNISSFFDTYEKILLSSDSEDFDQIPVVNQVSSIEKKLCEESAVTGPKEVQCLPFKSNDVLILPEQSKATTEKCNSLLSLDRQTNKHGYYEELETYGPHLTNQKEKVEDQNTYLNSENLLPSSSHVCPSVTLPLDSSIFVDTGVSDDGQFRRSSSAEELNENEKIHAMVQYPSRGSPEMTDTNLQLQAKETAQFSLQGHERTNETGSLEPATLKQHLEYVKEQEERNDKLMHVTNESQCETVMNNLIISHSEDESQTFIAAEEELKIHLSIMNNRCLEDAKVKYLPLENKTTHEFELKTKFDLVLEELHIFHEISKGNENNLSSLETNSHKNYWELNNSEGIDGNVTSVSQKKICISSPIWGTVERQNITDSNGSLLNEKILNENKDQEVPKKYCISSLSCEELLDSPVAEEAQSPLQTVSEICLANSKTPTPFAAESREYLGAAYRNPYTWDPAFLPCTLFKEQSYNLQKERGCFLSRDVIRVQPLKTCKGPIRIGLSRKARPKQLHPYLK